MITKKKGEILDKWTSLVVECPYCECDNYVTLDDYIDRHIVDIICGDCKDVFKIDMFECLCQSN